MYERVKDQRAWQLEQGQELSALREKVDAVQDTGVANCILDSQTAQGMATLDGRIQVLEKQGSFLLDQQEQESNTWHDITFNLCEEIQEGEQKMAVLQDLFNVQRRSNQQLCLNFNKAHQEVVAALKVARQEKRKRLAMKRELGELKEEFAKLKGIVCLVVASSNLQNNRFPTKDIQDVFNPQVTKSSSSEEEVPQENIVAIPVPGPSLEIPQTLQEIPPTPGLSL